MPKSYNDLVTMIELYKESVKIQRQPNPHADGFYDYISNVTVAGQKVHLNASKNLSEEGLNYQTECLTRDASRFKSKYKNIMQDVASEIFGSDINVKNWTWVGKKPTDQVESAKDILKFLGNPSSISYHASKSGNGTFHIFFFDRFRSEGGDSKMGIEIRATFDQHGINMRWAIDGDFRESSFTEANHNRSELERARRVHNAITLGGIPGKIAGGATEDKFRKNGYSDDEARGAGLGVQDVVDNMAMAATAAGIFLASKKTAKAIRTKLEDRHFHKIWKQKNLDTKLTELEEAARKLPIFFKEGKISEKEYRKMLKKLDVERRILEKEAAAVSVKASNTKPATESAESDELFSEGKLQDGVMNLADKVADTTAGSTAFKKYYGTLDKVSDKVSRKVTPTAEYHCEKRKSNCE